MIDHTLPPSGEPSIATVLARIDWLAARLDAPAKRFLSVEEAAEFTSLSATSIRQAIAGGHLTPHRPVSGRVVLDREQLIAWVLAPRTLQRSGRGRGRRKAKR